MESKQTEPVNFSKMNSLIRSNRLAVFCPIGRQISCLISQLNQRQQHQGDQSSESSGRHSGSQHQSNEPTDQPPNQEVKDFKYPEYFEFHSKRYRTDDWCNLPNSIIRHLTSPNKLYQLNNNPIHLISEGIKHHFSDYDIFEFRNPIVTTEANFDSLLIPKDHVSRSKSDCYYVNANELCRGHSSAHQLDCLKGHNSRRFVCIADVYRRDVVDSTHYPVFHQCEIFKVLDQVRVHCVLH